MDELWKGIEEVLTASVPFADKYRYYYDTLHRVCVDLTVSSPTQYSDLYSRLQAVCRLTHYPLKDIDAFRWRARRVGFRDMQVDECTFMLDVRAFVDAVAHFTKSAAPPRLLGMLPQAVSSLPPHSEQIEWMNRQQRMRFTVQSFDGQYALCVSEEAPSSEPYCVDTLRNTYTQCTAQLLKEGMNINALSYIVDRDGIIHPDIIVIEPDFLIDITTITGCVQAYGDSAFNNLVARLKPNKRTVYTLLGDFANQFLDDAFNQEHPDYTESMQKVFADRAIDICACKEIDKQFFATTRQQFDNILRAVDDIRNLPELKGHIERVQLEPSFFCEALGVQGRMDCLIDLQAGKHYLIELKSGKYDEYVNRARAEHTMQMLLYKEVLHYNLGIAQRDVIGTLLYSRYPNLQEQRSVTDIVHRAIYIRNSIVCMKRGIANGMSRQWLPALRRPEVLRRDPNCSDRFWTTWCLPVLRPVSDALCQMDALTAEYLYTFLQFVEREQFEAKVGDSAIGTDRAMSSLWRNDVTSKLDNGDIIVDLHVCDMRRHNNVPSQGIESVALSPKLTFSSTPNIRIGDAVVLYRRENEHDTVVNNQVVRCSVEDIVDGCIWVRLRHLQSNADIFSRSFTFAIEHDHIESTFDSLYSSVFSIVTASPRRRDLLLCQRAPEVDTSLTLTRHYANQQIDSIVLRAKQARDMFLLMGPPGTGKTSVALRSMVEEMLASGQRVLLLSYTNRAVDEICEMLANVPAASGYLRLGRDLSCAPMHRSHLLSNVIVGMTRSMVNATIANTPVVVSTVATMTSQSALLSLCRFDVAIFDEASQILEPHILSLLTSPSIGRFVMIGDHKQLPAVVVQSEDASAVASPLLHGIGLTNCRNSLFERLYERYRCDNSVVAMLDRQGRMHPDISLFPSHAFYDGRLRAVGLPHQQEKLPFVHYDTADTLQTLVATRRVSFIDVPSPSFEERRPKVNVAEAKMIVDLVDAIQRVCRQNGMEFDFSRHIGVIVPYRRQIALLRTLIEQRFGSQCSVMIDTVERYQGSQRDIIIYGTTVTQQYEVGTLSVVSRTASGIVDRKLNVALTRARKQLFLVGNRALLSRSPIYAKLFESTHTITPSRPTV